MKPAMCLRVFFLVAVTAFLYPTVWAQHASKSTGPKYDKGTEVTIKGVIEDMRQVPGEYEGVHLVVKCDTKTVLVHVAPGEFLKELEVSFNKGDQITVVGAKAPDAPEEEILAREITVGNNTTTLRDDSGVPIWAGWKPAKAAGN